MRAVRLIVLSIAGLVLAGLASSSALAQTNDRDCMDFASQSEAQAVLRADPTDPNGLDEDDDGVACDEFDYGPAVGSSAARSSSGTLRTADATNGAIAKTGTSSFELAVLGIFAILLGALIVRIAWGPVVLAPVSATRANTLLTTTLRDTDDLA